MRVSARIPIVAGLASISAAGLSSGIYPASGGAAAEAGRHRKGDPEGVGRSRRFVKEHHEILPVPVLKRRRKGAQGCLQSRKSPPSAGRDLCSLEQVVTGIENTMR